jgi:CubicO group peptidase (beta-lactamase class C family)
VRRWATALVLAVAPIVAAESLPKADPEAVGLSSERLARLQRTMHEAVDQGQLAGSVTMVLRDGRVAWADAYGDADREAGRPMRTDTIFRIASQTKALTSVAAMILVEEGRMTLSTPIAEFLPAFAHPKVALEVPKGSPKGTLPKLVDAKRGITVHDLLTHSSGYTYGDGPAAPYYYKAGLEGFYFADRPEPIQAVMEKLASVPLAFSPGEKYHYGLSSDLLGALVEKVSGQPLDVFFQRRILGPLRMDDTAFFLPPAKRERLAAVYASRTDGKRVERAGEKGEDGQGAYVDGPRRCFSGGAGLLSTAGDYARFLEMLLEGGQLDGVRILSPKTVELMTQNQSGRRFDDENGFGLGFEITTDGSYGSPGRFGWGGAYFTDYFVDPKERIVAVSMAQLRPDGPQDLPRKFIGLVYQAVVGPPRP